MNMKIKYSIIASLLLLVIFNSCDFKRFTEGVVEDANRMDTTEVPSVFNIDSINKTIDTLEEK